MKTAILEHFALKFPRGIPKNINVELYFKRVFLYIYKSTVKIFHIRYI